MEAPRTAAAVVPGLPILGSLLPIQRDALGFFTRVLREHGDRVQLRLPGRSVLLLCHPRDLEQVLVRDREAYGRSAELRNLRPIFGQGLLASDGALWRRQRALMQPSFNHSSLAAYSAVMLAKSSAQVGRWREGETREIHAEMMQYTRNVICTVLFGDDFAASAPGLGDAVMTVFGDLRSEVLYLPLWRRLPLPRSRTWDRAVRTLNRTIADTIAERRRSAAERSDMLGTLMAARGQDGLGMPDEQLHDEILTFFLAGHETAALALTWAAYLLARHPKIQNRMRQEVASLVRSGTLEPAHYAQLRYTQAVVKETLRLYPPVWSMGREATADTELDGLPVREGTDVWLCLHRMHRDPRWYSQPEEFLPERWLVEEPPAPYTYLPFGLGPRVCIGQHFAMAETVLGLASLLARFRLELLNEAPVEPSAWITLRPQREILLRLRAH